ncbi:MAG TPA: hypothetical protein ENI64_07140, partial [Gammaproteobacteria bacterium]|nr:hypothetical protein [Gammaproteobacteria bacterium]
VSAPPKHRSLGMNSKRPDQYPPRSNKEYADFLTELALRYPHVKAWQIWNEPNLRAFWQPKDDPAAYYELVKTTVKKLRAAAPGRTLVLGGMAYWSTMFKRGGLMLEELQKLGAFKLVDAIAYHPYLRTPYGDISSRHPYNFITTGLWLNDASRKLGARAIWATEWGWGSYQNKKEHDEVVSEEQQAEYTLQRLVLMMAMGFDKVFYFNISDLPDYVAPPHRDSGLLYKDGRPKPVYKALARFIKLLPGTLQPIKSPQVISKTVKRVWGFAWTTGDGRKVWIAWADQPGQVQIKAVRSVLVHALVSGTNKTINASNGSVRVQLGPAPILVELQ